MVDHELVGPKFKAKAENFHVNKSLSCLEKNIYGRNEKHDNIERKGIRFQFRNLLSIRLLLNMGLVLILATGTTIKKPSRGIGRVFFSVL